MLNRKERLKKVALSFSLRESGKNILTPKDTKNCDCRFGKLKTVSKARQLVNPDGSAIICNALNIVKVGVGKVYDGAEKKYAERFYALTQNGDFYLQDLESKAFTKLASGLKGAGVVRFAGENSRYRIALIGENSCLYIHDNGETEIAMLEGTAKTGCFFKHRMFVGMHPSKIVCSAPEDELDFTESLTDGGMIRFPNVGGEIVAVQAFEHALYLFFEYGILRLNVDGKIKDFTAEKLEYAGGKIFGKTVCVGNRAVYFMAFDGAYRFDGEHAEKLLPNFVVSPSEETFLESGAVGGGQVFFRYKADSGMQTLVLYEDGKDGFYIQDLPALSIEEGGRYLFTAGNGGFYELNETGNFGVEGYFLGAETDFGIVGRKTLTKLCFKGKGSFVLTVKNGGRRFERTVDFQDGEAEVKLSERGERFAFDLRLSSGSQIESMTAELKTLA